MITKGANKRGRYRWLRRLLRLIVVLFVILNVMAAFHAYKLTHNFEGDHNRVKGPDQMNFGAKLKALFFGVKNYKSAVNTFPTVAYATIKLHTESKLEIEAWLIKNDTAKGTVILFHGHLGNKSSMLEQAKVFSELGFNTMLVDFRAHGNSNGSACTIGKKEAEEVKLAFEYLISRGEKKIILWGTSMGAVAICSAITSYKLSPSLVILEMPFGSLKEAVEGRVRMMGLPVEPIASLLTFWGGVEHGFWAFDFKPSRYAASITCPALLQWGKLDKRVSERETLRLFENLGTANKKLEIYPVAAHEALIKKDSLHWRNAVSSFIGSNL